MRPSAWYQRFQADAEGWIWKKEHYLQWRMECGKRRGRNLWELRWRALRCTDRSVARRNRQRNRKWKLMNVSIYAWTWKLLSHYPQPQLTDKIGKNSPLTSLLNTILSNYPNTASLGVDPTLPVSLTSWTWLPSPDSHRPMLTIFVDLSKAFD